MSLDFEYPSLTAMLDQYFRPMGPGDEAAVQAFVQGADEGTRQQVLFELDRIVASQHDAFELRGYLMVHRFDMIPEDGAEAWLSSLRELIAHADFF